MNGARLKRFAYWRTGYGIELSDRADFYLIQAGEFHCKPGYRTGSFENADHTQFFYHLDGEATFEAPGQCISVSPGDLIIAPLFHPFSYENQQTAKYHWFAVGGEWPRAMGDAEVKHFSFGRDDRIETIFIEMREVLILRRPGYPLRAIAILFELMARIEGLSKTTVWPDSIYPEAVRNAIVYLRENADRAFSATETARAVGLSPSYLRALFEKWLGESPRRFHMGCRIELAKQLLTEQHLSPFEVASQISFADVHHFSRVFKQVTGLSPSQYTKRQFAQ